jgi:ABC-type branched-subunit amino acid transport system ATPase component
MSDISRTAPALEVRGLDVYYGHSHALQGVDLRLDSGVFSLVGRNGMGKTTLCNAIMGLLRPSGGTVRLRGEDITRLNPARIARLGVGYVPQGRRLWRSLSVDEHLRLAAGMRRGPWTVERVYETFPRLAERRNNGGGQLSGGEQQMLSVARALLGRPRLILLDEPLEGLAPLIRQELLHAFQAMSRETGIAVVIVEQQVDEALKYARRALVLDHGTVVHEGDAQALLRDTGTLDRWLGMAVH